MLSDSTRLLDDESEREVMITSILRKKRPLLDDDVSWIEKDIVAYGRKLSSVETQIALLTRRKEQLERSLSRRKSVLSPIHRLPRDILVEIFRWAVHHPKNSLDVTKGVWPLGQVCGWWWDVVLASPILWSVVILEPPYTQHSTDILAHHFRRSSGLPLWIAIATEDNTDSDGHVFDIVIQQSALWKMMDMSAPPKDLAKLCSVSGNIPLLEELYVSTQDNVHFNTDALSSAPSLRRADLESLEISKLPVNATLLTHFTGTLHHSADIQYIAQIQTLIDIRILIFDDPDGALDSGNLLPVRMEQLQFLSVDNIKILDALTAPSLRTIDYCPASVLNEGDNSIHSLRDFLARSACSISYLGICVEMIQKIDHLMAFAKNVSYLTVYYSNGHSALDPLTLPGTLPAMKSLRLSIIDASWNGRYAGGVIDVVRQRFDEERAAVLNVTELSYLRIDCVDESRAEIIDWLKGEGHDALEEEGLELEQKSPYLPVDEYWMGSWFT